jgi:hypothetical protein
VPVSTVDDIEVEVEKKSGADFNKETGEIIWEFTLKPNGTKEFELRYNVEYPKHRNLRLE